MFIIVWKGRVSVGFRTKRHATRRLSFLTRSCSLWSKDERKRDAVGLESTHQHGSLA